MHAGFLVATEDIVGQQLRSGKSANHYMLH